MLRLGHRLITFERSPSPRSSLEESGWRWSQPLELRPGQTERYQNAIPVNNFRSWCLWTDERPQFHLGSRQVGLKIRRIDLITDLPLSGRSKWMFDGLVGAHGARAPSMAASSVRHGYHTFTLRRIKEFLVFLFRLTIMHNTQCGAEKLVFITEVLTENAFESCLITEQFSFHLQVGYVTGKNFACFFHGVKYC